MAPVPPSQGKKLLLQPGMGVLAPKWEYPPVIYADIYRKHIGLLIPNVEEQCVSGPGRALGQLSG